MDNPRYSRPIESHGLVAGAMDQLRSGQMDAGQAIASIVASHPVPEERIEALGDLIRARRGERLIGRVSLPPALVEAALNRLKLYHPDRG